MRPPRLLVCAILACLPLTTVSASVGSAAAVVHYSPVDLANRAIPLGEDADVGDLETTDVAIVVGLPQPVPDCGLAIRNGRLVPHGDCDALWAMVDPGRLDLELGLEDGGSVHLQLRPSWDNRGGRAALDVASATLTLPSDTDLTSLITLRYVGGQPRAWVARDVSEGVVALDAESAAAFGARPGRSFAYADTGEGHVSFQLFAAQGLMNPTQPVTPGPHHAGATDADDGAAVSVHTRNTADPTARGQWVVTAPAAFQCPPAELPHEDMIVVCVDATSDVLKYRMVPEGTRLTKPNRYFFVHVLHFVDRRVEVNLGGQIGTWVPGTRGDLSVRSRRRGAGGGIGGAQGVTAPELTYSTQTLAPRQPGYAPLTVRMSDLSDRPVGSPLLVEFWIDETYSGAFRLGIAGVVLGGVDQTYSKVTRPGSKQAEIVASDPNPVDIDLVVGYAPYLDSGGRSATGCESAPFCFSPYFGLGVVSASTNGDLEFLKSVHLGVEWELTSTFAFGVTANLRRVSRLGAGLEAGQPIDGAVPTEDRYVFGVGFVINLSPAFMKIGAGGAAALLR